MQIAFRIKMAIWAFPSTRPHGSHIASGRHDSSGPARAETDGIGAVALSEIDRNLLERCLERRSRAWEDFVDRFMGLVVHVINHTAQARSVRLTPEDRDDLCAEVLLSIIRDDFAILRRFRGQSSLATYLTVVTRRIVVKRMMRQKPSTPVLANPARPSGRDAGDTGARPEQRISDREEVSRLLEVLGEGESRIVRMYHLEGKSYHEISETVGVPVNSIGPILSRARKKMRSASVN